MNLTSYSPVSSEIVMLLDGSKLNQQIINLSYRCTKSLCTGLVIFKLSCVTEFIISCLFIWGKKPRFSRVHKIFKLVVMGDRLTLTV